MKRPSRGRGEYEIAGTHADLRAADLAGSHLLIDAGPFGVRRTDVRLEQQGGKLRLRLGDSAEVHLPRQLEAHLLLPKSTRDESTLSGGLPVLREGRYVLARMNCSAVELDESGTEATLTFDECLAVSDVGNAVRYAINVPLRLRQIERLHKEAVNFVEPIDDLLRAHAQALEDEGPLGRVAEQLVQQLMQATEEQAGDYGITYVAGTDVLDTLEAMLRLPRIELPTEIDAAQDPDIRFREVRELRRLAASRGSSAIRFSREVRAAYNSTCVVCGLRLPRSEFCSQPGVDSAHILPYSAYELDVVQNGVCLCKTHHWAFDEGLIFIEATGAGAYEVVVTQRGQRALADDPSTLDELTRWEGAVPEERLPADPAQRPSPAYIRRLREDLEATHRPPGDDPGSGQRMER